MKKVQIHFICGKGGVGKSTVSGILRKKFEEQGLNTLLVTVNADTDVPGSLNVTPAESLREYLKLKIKSEYIFKLVFDNLLMKSWLQFVPALAELNMLGKIWYEAEKHIYDRIVVDCPATGHGYQFLSVAKVTAEAVKHGPIAQEAAAMAATLADPKRSCVHIVTLLEELPVNESIELIKKFQASKIVPLGSLIMNAVLDPIFDTAPNTEIRIAYERYLEEQEQRRQIEKIEKENLGMTIERWPHELG